ncbi:hypothetical protein LSAT2_014438 [Lamellibrachia satsuma]|nr:hypothetical protein LSAT2_014438 [Lamellibrachia satsuma]
MLPTAPRDTGSMKRKTKSTLPEVMGTKPGRDIFPTTKAILEKCSKPLIGMSFITECQVSDGNYEPRYLCGLCQGKCDPRTLLSHILGGKHRIAYFKEKYPEYYGEVFKDKTMRKSEVSPIIERCALLVEKAEGRQLMKTIIDNDIIENCFTKTKADDSHRGRGRGTSSFSRGFSQTLPRGREQTRTFNSRGGRGGAMSSRGSRGGFSSRGLGNGSSGRGQRGGGERGNYSSRGQRGFGGRGQVRGSRGRGQRGSFSPSPRGGFGRRQMKQESYGWPGDSYWEQSAYGDTGYGDMRYSDVGYGDTAYGDSGYGMLGKLVPVSSILHNSSFCNRRGSNSSS